MKLSAHKKSKFQSNMQSLESRQSISRCFDDEQLDHGNLKTELNDKSSRGVVVIAATNRLADLDEAVIRRFDSKVYVGVPTRTDRENLLVSFLGNIETTLTKHDIQLIANELEGWSGSDIEALCREAALSPIRSQFHFSQSTTSTMNSHVHITKIRPVTLLDFQNAQQKLVPNKSDCNSDEEYGVLDT